MSLTIGYDLCFATLPHGGKTACQLLPTLINIDPNAHWVIYHNNDRPLQQAIINDVMHAHNDRVQLREIRSRVLSLTHHIDVYFYLHFDMPISVTDVLTVMMIHDLYPLVLYRYCSKLKQVYFKSMTTYNTRRAKTVIAIFQSTKNDLVKYIGADPEKIIVIPQGTAAQFQIIKDRSILDRVTKRYQLSPSFLLYCGMHKKHKNLERLISAYDQLPATIKQRFPLVITGKPSTDTDSLRSQVKQRSLENNIHFIEYVPEDHLSALNTLASLSILPSLYEGFGVTPIESMACGTPAIGSNTSAIPEVIGGAGRLLDPYNIDDITQKFVTAVAHDVNNQAVQQKCRDHVKQFSWDIKAASTSKQLVQATGK